MEEDFEWPFTREWWAEFWEEKRELEEETGIRSVKLITTVDEWLEYDLPKNLLGKISLYDNAAFLALS